MNIDNKKPGDGIVAERDSLIEKCDELKQDLSVVKSQLTEANRVNAARTTENAQLRDRIARLEGERDAYGDILEKAMDKLLEAGR